MCVYTTLATLITRISHNITLIEELFDMAYNTASGVDCIAI